MGARLEILLVIQTIKMRSLKKASQMFSKVTTIIVVILTCITHKTQRPCQNPCSYHSGTVTWSKFADTTLAVLICLWTGQGSTTDAFYLTLASSILMEHSTNSSMDTELQENRIWHNHWTTSWHKLNLLTKNAQFSIQFLLHGQSFLTEP